MVPKGPSATSGAPWRTEAFITPRGRFWARQIRRKRPDDTFITRLNLNMENDCVNAALAMFTLVLTLIRVGGFNSRYLPPSRLTVTSSLICHQDQHSN